MKTISILSAIIIALAGTQVVSAKPNSGPIIRPNILPKPSLDRLVPKPDQDGADKPDRRPGS